VEERKEDGTYVGGWIYWKYMYVSGKTKPFETIPGIVGGDDKEQW
jgi:hypothetical protein